MIQPVIEESLNSYKDAEYKELATYAVHLPKEPMSLGLSGVLDNLSTLSGMLNRVESMLEDARRQYTIKDTVLTSYENAFKHNLAILIHTGVTNAAGQIVFTKDELLKMRSAYMQEAAALQNPEFAALSHSHRQAEVDRTLAKGYLDAVQARYERLTKVGYELNAIKEILITMHPGTFFPSHTAPATHT